MAEKSASLVSVSTAATSTKSSLYARRGVSSRMPQVAMPFSAIEMRKEGVRYGIHVTGQEGEAWRVWHSYEEFQQFYQALGNADWDEAPFPARMTFKCICMGQRQRIEERRRALEAWLCRALREAGSREPWAETARGFLQVPSKHAGAMMAAVPEAPDAEKVPQSLSSQQELVPTK